jgi:hypothetical protein
MTSPGTTPYGHVGYDRVGVSPRAGEERGEHPDYCRSAASRSFQVIHIDFHEGVDLAFLVVTRLRLADPKYLDEFVGPAFAVVDQANNAEGNLAAEVLADALTALAAVICLPSRATDTDNQAPAGAAVPLLDPVA